MQQCHCPFAEIANLVDLVESSVNVHYGNNPDEVF